MDAAALDAFPSLPLPALDGPPRDLSRAVRPTLVVFGHGDCRTTRLLLPFVERIARRRGPDRDVVVVLQDTPDEARALAADLGLTMPVLLDAEPWALGTALRTEVVPLTMIVEQGGAVAGAWPAFRRADLERAAELFGAAPLFGPDDDVPALRPG
jgi:peroxiredoxin